MGSRKITRFMPSSVQCFPSDIVIKINPAFLSQNLTTKKLKARLGSLCRLETWAKGFIT
jgi:hypothetical protein